MRAFVNYSRSLFICLMLLMVSPVMAHQMSTAYLQLSHQSLLVPLFNTTQAQPAGEHYVYGQLQLRWIDLGLFVELDTNADEELSWAEIDANSQKIKQYAADHIQLSAAGQPCPLTFDDEIQTQMHEDDGYLVLSFSSNCLAQVSAADSAELDIHYSAIFAQRDDHSLLVSGELFGQPINAVIDQQHPTLSLSADSNSLATVIRTYIYQGILHIFKGTDHILFLCALLLTCALQREQNQWQFRNNTRQIFTHTAWVITAFTLAHSLTLTATAMDLMVPSSRWVEFGIARSVVMTARNNIWPLVLRLGWITFAFGLLHGMGFAGVLGELGIDKQQKLVSVLAFNFGVELGQLMILAVLLPLLLVCSKRRWYQQFGLQGASAVIGIIALQWCIERL